MNESKKCFNAYKDVQVDSGRNICGIVCVEHPEDHVVRVIYGTRDGNIGVVNSETVSVEKTTKAEACYWLEVHRYDGKLTTPNVVITCHEKKHINIWDPFSLKKIWSFTVAGGGCYWRICVADNFGWGDSTDMELLCGGWGGGSLDYIKISKLKNNSFKITETVSFMSQMNNKGYICYAYQMRARRDIFAVAVHNQNSIKLISMREKKIIKTILIPSPPKESSYHTSVCLRCINSYITKFNTERLLCSDERGNFFIFDKDGNQIKYFKNKYGLGIWSILDVNNELFVISCSNSKAFTLTINQFKEFGKERFEILEGDFTNQNATGEVFHKIQWVDDNSSRIAGGTQDGKVCFFDFEGAVVLRKLGKKKALEEEDLEERVLYIRTLEDNDFEIEIGEALKIDLRRVILLL